MGTSTLRRLFLALTRTVLVLELDIVLDLVAWIQQIIQAHTIKFGERNQILRIRRALRTLPLAHRLTRKAQLARKSLLAVALTPTEIGKPLRRFYVHVSSYTSDVPSEHHLLRRLVR